MLSREELVEVSAVTAALLEASADKPGNVSPLHSKGRTRFEHYIASSAAIGPEMRRISTGEHSLGQGIFHAVNRSMSVQRGGNVHLGVILLFGPMASAAGSSDSLDLASLRKEISAVLSSAAYEDTVYVYNAMKHAGASGISGDVLSEDALRRIIEERIPLKEWMAEGKDKNPIAGEYCSDYRITFEMTLPAIRERMDEGKTVSHAIREAFLEFLSKHPDSHIAGIFGDETAEDISRRAGEVLKSGETSSIAEFDAYLREKGINPGTTADLMASGLYLGLLSGEISF